VFCCLLSGCLIGDDAQRRLANNLPVWVPAGTPKDQAIGIMRAHGFNCADLGLGNLLCEKRGLFRDLHVSMT